jgi:hypothetical protein
MINQKKKAESREQLTLNMNLSIIKIAGRNFIFTIRISCINYMLENKKGFL